MFDFDSSAIKNGQQLYFVISTTNNNHQGQNIEHKFI